jgi:hypothetical protein
MHKILIVALVLAGLAGAALTGTASATKIEMSPAELKDYCDKKGGYYASGGSGGGNCQIGTGKNQVNIACGANGKCTMTRTMVFTSNPSTHGPIGQGSVATLGNNGKPSVSGNGTAGAVAGTSTSNKAPVNGDNKTASANGDSVPQNYQPYLPGGRPRMQAR